MKIIKKAQSGIMSTKLKDVPGKVKNAVTTGFNKAVDKVKNTTVGDAAEFIASPAYSATESAVEALNKKSNSKKPVLKTLNKGRPIVKKGTMKSKNGSKIIKKAQDGLRTGQYKRIGRIAEKNPERAERVAERMNTRASRVDRGKGIANPPIMRSNIMKELSDRKPYHVAKEKGMTLPTVTVTSSRKKAMKAGGMLKRADGSYSKRGLWDNIRANKGSGKKPTSAMLKQEKKIKAKTK